MYFEFNGLYCDSLVKKFLIIIFIGKDETIFNRKKRNSTRKEKIYNQIKERRKGAKPFPPPKVYTIFNLQTPLEIDSKFLCFCRVCLTFSFQCWLRLAFLLSLITS